MKSRQICLLFYFLSAFCSGSYIHILFQGNILSGSETAMEVTVIRKMAPVNLIVHYPQTPEGREELSRRVSEVHAAAVNQRLKSLNCPTSQKLELLNALIRTVQSGNREQTL